ncbi:MAG: imidazole glycerol phosphate synthase subunit HisF [Gammaproteobacteria bacterium]|nr:imidazole glycerol phosphate synthase subunit HisF [Gammaproteobacteria bacterium]
MALPRIIPILLIQNGVLVKGKNFKKHRYIGDPINAIRIFNDSQVDELIVLDITANGNLIDVEQVKTFCGECFMPLAVGGGIRTTEEARGLLRSGAEKVILNSAFFSDPRFIKKLSDEFGSQSIVVSIDYKHTGLFSKRDLVFTNCGKKKTSLAPLEAAKRAEQAGAGEIMITSIDREGSYSGYDLETLISISATVTIPIIVNGGAGITTHLLDAVRNGASAAAAGSMFVFHGPREAVLISYPDTSILDEFN